MMGLSFNILHSRNGIILARSSSDKRYSRIEVGSSPDQIINITAHAPSKFRQFNNQNLNQSQSLSGLPHGHVAQQTANLEDYVVPRQTRSQKQGQGIIPGEQK